MHVRNESRGLAGAYAQWTKPNPQPGSDMRRLSLKPRARVVCGLILLVLAQWGTVNEFAQQALWIHAVQSVMLHHVAPGLIFSGACSAKTVDAACEAGQANCSAYLKLWSVLAAVVFALVSVVWMIPVVHALVMTDAVLFSAMNVSMLLSGAWLILTFRIQGPFAARTTLFWMFCVVPVASLGVELCISTPLYALDMALCRASAGSSLDGIAGMLVHSLSWSADQRLAGGVYLFAAGWHGFNYAHNAAYSGAAVTDWRVVQSDGAQRATLSNVHAVPFAR
ncbi:cytochrome c oxidase assembly protein [Burkholderia sp. GS2Y]|uniref:Cytochrome c oxidase assembly protein n=1 Tax=Burkholderia theae TaxID=3143496 RepID=A0ABU9WST3_9BURK